MGTDSRGGVTAAYFGNVYPHTLARTERDEGNDVMVNCGENPGSLPASSTKRVFLWRWCDVIGPQCRF